MRGGVSNLKTGSKAALKTGPSIPDDVFGRFLLTSPLQVADHESRAVARGAARPLENIPIASRVRSANYGLSMLSE